MLSDVDDLTGFDSREKHEFEYGESARFAQGRRKKSSYMDLLDITAHCNQTGFPRIKGAEKPTQCYIETI